MTHTADDMHDDSPEARPMTTIDSTAHRAVAKAIMLHVQLRDFGHLIGLGDFKASADQIDLLERSCNDAATAAIAAYLSALPAPSPVLADEGDYPEFDTRNGESV